MTEAQRTSQVRQTVTRRIQTLGRQKRPKEAVSQLAEMARLGVQPDTQAATALIDACVRNKKMDMAQSVFEELFGEQSQVDNIVLMHKPALNASHVQANFLEVRGQQLTGSAKKNHVNNAGEFLQPDDVTFSVLMRGYGEMNPPSWVLISGLLKMMDKKFSMKPSLGNLSLESVFNH